MHAIKIKCVCQNEPEHDTDTLLMWSRTLRALTIFQHPRLVCMHFGVFVYRIKFVIYEI